MRQAAFPCRPLAAAAVLTIVLVGAAGVTLGRAFDEFARVTQTELRIRSLAGTITHLDEVLTMSARMAVATGDPSWEHRYRTHEPELDAAIQEAMALAPEAQSVASASATDAANKKLVAMENEAFSLVGAQRRPEAALILHSARYVEQKEAYAAGMTAMRQVFDARAHQVIERQRAQGMTAVGVAAMLLTGLLLLWLRIAANVRRFLLALQTAEQELTRANERLEQRVRERTVDLEAANAALTAEMVERNRVELELRQAQKLEAVGRLAGGLAHQMNTPLQYSMTSVAFLRGVFDDIHAKANAGVTAEEQALLVEDATAAFQSTKAGLQRIAALVRSMREFAQADQAAKAATDLNSALEATLAIARDEWNRVATIEKQLDAALPPVVCMRGEMNQVFLAILQNAAHAIEDRVANSDERGVIRVCTRTTADDVIVEIADTGSGIPESDRDKVFDPFFTTKSIGRGTGQGLALAWRVVKQHGGTIEFESTVGVGTTFRVRLPRQRTAQEREADMSCRSMTVAHERAAEAGA